jgi:hypothetical protein
MDKKWAAVATHSNYHYESEDLALLRLHWKEN